MIWLAIQIAAVVLGSLQIQSASGSAGFPRPAELLTPRYVTAVQIGAAALFFPLLMPSIGSVLLAIAAIWPFQFAAGALAGAGMGSAATVALYVSAWLAGLATLACVCKTPFARLIASSLASLAAWGGAIGGYLSHEFGSPLSSTGPSTSAHFGPIWEAMRLISSGRWEGNWAFISAFWAICVALVAARRSFTRTRRSRRNRVLFSA